MQGTKQAFSIPAVQIEDSPRFEWRGFMLDASRHFWNKDEVKHILDLMSLYKLNKFHWHLTDDQGWRIEIEKYPLLTEKGAWRKFNKHDRGCMERAVEEDNTDFLIPENKIRIVEGDTLYGGCLLYTSSGRFTTVGRDDYSVQSNRIFFQFKVLFQRFTFFQGHITGNRLIPYRADFHHKVSFRQILQEIVSGSVGDGSYRGSDVYKRQDREWYAPQNSLSSPHSVP